MPPIPSAVYSVAAPAPGRADSGLAPGVGRDGRAITAGIAPQAFDTARDLVDKLIGLSRDRLYLKHGGNPARMGGPASVVYPNRFDDAALPGVANPQGIGGFTWGQIIGAAVLIGALAWATSGRRRGRS